MQMTAILENYTAQCEPNLGNQNLIVSRTNSIDSVLALEKVDASQLPFPASQQQRHLTDVFFHLLRKSVGLVPSESETQPPKLYNGISKYSASGRVLNKVEVVEEDATEIGCREAYPVNIIEDGELNWSPDAVTLKQYYLQKKLKQPDKTYLCSHFSTLKLIDKKITTIDKDTRNFLNLTDLSLSVNFVDKIQFLPKSLTVLNAYGNRIETLETCIFPTSLVHLGLGFNLIQELRFPTHSNLANVISLDLSYNQMYQLSKTITALKTGMPQLKQLTLIGNPFCILNHYRPCVLALLPNLQVLDDSKVSQEEIYTASKNFTPEILNTDNCTISFHLDVIQPVNTSNADHLVPSSFGHCFHVEYQWNNDRHQTDPFPTWKPTWNLDFEMESHVIAGPGLMKTLKDIKLLLVQTNFKETLPLSISKPPTTSKQPRVLDRKNSIIKEKGPKISPRQKKLKEQKLIVTEELEARITRSPLQIKAAEDLKAHISNPQNIESVTVIGKGTMDLSCLLECKRFTEAECLIEIPVDSQMQVSDTTNGNTDMLTVEFKVYLATLSESDTQ